MIVKTALCNLCSAPTTHHENDILYADGSIDREKVDLCPLCNHVVRGSISCFRKGALRQNHQEFYQEAT